MIKTNRFVVGFFYPFLKLLFPAISTGCIEKTNIENSERVAIKLFAWHGHQLKKVARNEARDVSAGDWW